MKDNGLSIVKNQEAFNVKKTLSLTLRELDMRYKTRDNPRELVNLKKEHIEYFRKKNDPLVSAVLENTDTVFDFYERVRKSAKKYESVVLHTVEYSFADALTILKRHVHNVALGRGRTNWHDYTFAGVAGLGGTITADFFHLSPADSLLAGAAATGLVGIPTILRKNRSLFHMSPWDYAVLEDVNLSFYKQKDDESWMKFHHNKIPSQLIKSKKFYSSIASHFDTLTKE